MSGAKVASPPRVDSIDADWLRRWLDASGRAYVVLRASDLVDAVEFPIGIEKFRHILGRYEAYRRRQSVQIPCFGYSGRCLGDDGCICGGTGLGSRAKSDRLELDELKDAAMQLIRDIRAKEPGWRPDD